MDFVGGAGSLIGAVATEAVAGVGGVIKGAAGVSQGEALGGGSEFDAVAGLTEAVAYAAASNLDVSVASSGGTGPHAVGSAAADSAVEAWAEGARWPLRFSGTSPFSRCMQHRVTLLCVCM